MFELSDIARLPNSGDRPELRKTRDKYLKVSLNDQGALNEESE